MPALTAENSEDLVALALANIVLELKERIAIRPSSRPQKELVLALSPEDYPSISEVLMQRGALLRKHRFTNASVALPAIMRDAEAGRTALSKL